MVPEIVMWIRRIFIDIWKLICKMRMWAFALFQAIYILDRYYDYTEKLTENVWTPMIWLVMSMVVLLPENTQNAHRDNK